MASFILIIGGLALLGTGGWMFYQYQLEASKPPPARILEVSVADAIETPTPQPSPTNIKPTATLPTVSDNAPPVEPASLNTSPSPSTQTVDPVENSDLVENTIPAEEAAPVQEAALEKNITSEAATPPQETVTSVTEAKFLEEAALAQENVLTSEPITHAVPSLADNPLVVAEDAPASAAAAGDPAAAPASLPPTRIVVDSIDLDAKVVEVGWQQVIQDGVSTNVWVVADYAAGWHKNSMLPGQGGNIVLSGHHNIKGETFRYLVDLDVGDIVSLYVGDQRYDYAVNDKFILKDKGEPESVRRANARWIGPFNEERLTLVTCWPYNNNSHRLIVVAKPV